MSPSIGDVYSMGACSFVWLSVLICTGINKMLSNASVIYILGKMKFHNCLAIH